MAYFVVFATDNPGMGETRLENRPAHRRRLREHDHPLTVFIGGPTHDARGAMNGTVLVIEADSEVAALGITWGLGRPETA